MSAEDRVEYWKRRAHQAETLLRFEEDDRAHLLNWFTERISRERELSDRCTFLYGVARSLGASPADLAGPMSKTPPWGVQTVAGHIDCSQQWADSMTIPVE